MSKSRVDSDGTRVPERFVRAMIAEHKRVPGTPIPSRQVTSDASSHAAPPKRAFAKLPGSTFLFIDSRGIKYYRRTKSSQWAVLPPSIDGAVLMPPNVGDVVKVIYAKADGGDSSVLNYAVTESQFDPIRGSKGRKTGWVRLEQTA